MKIFLILLLCTAFTYSDSLNKPDCKKFKTGRFRLTDTDQEYYIDRNDSVQEERDAKKNAISKFKVTWISECEYEMVVLDGNEEMLEFYKGKSISIKIVDTSDKGYRYETKVKGTDMKLIHTVEKVVE